MSYHRYTDTHGIHVIKYMTVLAVENSYLYVLLIAYFEAVTQQRVSDRSVSDSAVYFGFEPPDLSPDLSIVVPIRDLVPDSRAKLRTNLMGLTANSTAANPLCV